jgi:hypothetical protein
MDIQTLEFFKKIFNNYDTNKLTYKDIIRQIHNQEAIDASSDLELHKIRLTDKQNKIIGEYPFELIGVYYNKLKIWNWSWVLVGEAKNKTNMSRSLSNYGLNIDWFNSSKQDQVIKLTLINPRILIEDYFQIELILAITLYLSKKRGFIHKIRKYIDKDKTNFYDQYIFVYIK